MAHSNQLREFILSDKGIELLDLYQGTEGVLFGSARMAQQSREVSDRLIRNEEIERKQRELDSKKLVMENEIALLRAKFAREEDEMKTVIGQDVHREKAVATAMKEISVQRKADR
jgi:circadian clock protein KaiC